MRTSLGRSTAGSFFGLVCVAMLLIANREPISADAIMSFRAAQLWLDTGSMALQPGDFPHYALVTSPDGRQYSKYPPLAFVNGLAAAWLAGHCRAAPAALYMVGLAVVPAVWTALTALGLALVLVRLGLGARTSLVLASLSIVSTPLVLYGRGYYAEMSQAAGLIMTLLAADMARENERFTWFAGFALGLAVTAKAAFLVLVPCVALALPMRQWPRFALGLVPGAVIVAAYNYARYQDVFAFGYGSERDGTIGFGTPVFVGLFGNLLSPGKSVFLYAPVLVFAPWGMWALVDRARRFWLLTWALPSVLLIVVASKWWAWSGDSAWGPRLIVPLVPGLLLPAWLLWQRGHAARVGLVVLAALGVLVQLPALLISEYTYVDHAWRLARPAMATLATQPSAMADDSLLTHFVPWMSPVVAQAWLVLVKLFGVEALGAPPWAANGFDKLRTVPELPGWNWWFDGSPAAIALGAGLFAASVALLAHLRNMTRQPGRPDIPRGGPALGG